MGKQLVRYVMTILVAFGLLQTCSILGGTIERPLGQEVIGGMGGPQANPKDASSLREGFLTHDRLPVDMVKSCKSLLSHHGVTDFNTPNLIMLLSDTRPGVRASSALLLGEMMEKDAIAALRRSLEDESNRVKIAAARALLKMGNRDGVKCLLQMLEGFLARVRAGEYRYQDILDMEYATLVLSYAGEASAIPYLRFLANDHRSNWPTRLSTLRSFARLYDKDPTVLENIVAMQKDPEALVRAEAVKITRLLKPDHPSVSLEVLNQSIFIMNAKKGQTHSQMVVIRDRHLDPNELGTLQIASVVSISGSKVKVVQTRPVRQGCQVQLEIQDPNRPVAIQVQSPDGGKVAGFDVDYLVIRFTDGRELTIPVQFHYDMGPVSNP